MKPLLFTPPKFRLNQKYLTDAPNEKFMTLYIPATGQTISGMSYGTNDHPKFSEIRDKLEKQGYIKTERSYINGDRVLKPFTLNGMMFTEGEQFSCACAMGIKLKVWRKYNK